MMMIKIQNLNGCIIILLLFGKGININNFIANLNLGVNLEVLE